jgi:two-component system phosphate regulon sensor histidine kinase PhoR
MRLSGHWARSFKRFWSAEEVPRWFGLSLLLVCMGGLGVVWRLTVREEQRQAVDTHRLTSSYAVKLLADKLAAAPSSSAGKPDAGHSQRALRDFTGHLTARSVRVVGPDGRIVASNDVQEMGTSVRPDPPVQFGDDGLQLEVLPATALRDAQSLIRARVLRPAGDETSGFGYVEAVLPLSPSRSTLSTHAGTLGTVLIVCGLMFGLLRGLRSQLRSAKMIAERLSGSPRDLGDDIRSLRLADSEDAVATAWNQLIDLTSDLRAEVARTEAYRELSSAFESRRAGGGGGLAQALHAVPDGIIHITGETRFDYLNSTAAQLLGWGEGDSSRRTLADAAGTACGTKILQIIRSAARPNGTFAPHSELMESPEGQSTYRVWVTPMPTPRQNGECVVMVRDISQQARSEKAREEFVTQVTHELRTPLTNIRAYAETLSSGMFDDPNVVTECYNVITKETRRLSRLIEDILSVSQMEVGAIELHLDDVDLKAVLSEAVRDVRGLADEKNIDLQLVLPPKLEPIKADRDKIAVVVNNLLGNAIKYTPNNGSVIVGCQMSTEHVSITIKDNGIGIDPADQARVFEKFQRANDPDVLAEVGTGIGLYTAREIVRRHGGNIELISKKGEGSTFVVKLPPMESRATSLTVS